MHNGLPQGHNEARSTGNLSINDALKNILRIKELFIYNYNVSALDFADDSSKIAFKLKDL